MSLAILHLLPVFVFFSRWTVSFSPVGVTAEDLSFLHFSTHDGTILT